MKKRTFIPLFTGLLLIFGLLTVQCTSKSSSASQQDGKGVKDSVDKSHPNIILFIADDLTFRDIEPYGSEVVKTPNLSRLAQQGITLDGMYTATAMCSPTRQQLYTGMFPVRNGAYPNHSWVYKGVKSLPDYLRPLGYRVGIVGKEDFGPPSSFPFKRVGGKPKKDIVDGNLFAIKRYINKSDAPFFLLVASHQSHVPWNKGNPGMYDHQIKVPPYLVDIPATKAALKKYYSEITYLDKEVGNVMDILKRSGKADNTVFIFTSEQGAQLPFAKWTCYENGLKTAFIVRWPGKIKPGTRSKALIEYVDVVPTLIEIAGGNPDTVHTGRPDASGYQGFDGKSFLPVLLGKTNSFRDYVYGVQTTLGIIGAKNPYPIRSISNGRYKLIRNLNADEEFYNVERTAKHSLFNKWVRAAKKNKAIAPRVHFYYKRPPLEFYDLQNDPYELHNLAEGPAYKDIIEKLKQKLNDWMQQQGDHGMKTELHAKSRLARNIRKRNDRGL